jgi:CRP/FNR family transcriptional regulator, nitrogen fixation regulation protein
MFVTSFAQPETSQRRWPDAGGRCTNSSPSKHHLAAAAAQPAAGTAPEPFVPASTVMHYERDEEIIAQDDVAEYGFQVVSGCVRTVRLLEDGRRQVGEFLLPGDVFGWEMGREHAFGAEAVTPVVLHRFPLRALEEKAVTDTRFARQLRQQFAAQMRRMRGQLLLLGRKTAFERIASFLVEMSERLHVGSESAIELPMSRTDIADYLGMTIETVCRGLSDLRQRGTIAVERSRIAIRDRRALGVAGSDRVH